MMLLVFATSRGSPVPLKQQLINYGAILTSLWQGCRQTFSGAKQAWQDHNVYKQNPLRTWMDCWQNQVSE